MPLLLDATVEDEEFCLCFDASSELLGPRGLVTFHYCRCFSTKPREPAPELRALVELPWPGPRKCSRRQQAGGS